MRVLFDTYAWVEYFLGTTKGKIVEKILEQNEVLTPVIVLVELSCKAARERWNFNKQLEFIKAKSLILDIGEKVILKTGRVYLKMRSKIKDFGLIDSIILATSMIEMADIVTGDKHFRNMNNVKYLK